MVGKIAVIPYAAEPFGFQGAYSYYRICLGDLVWKIAISPAVKSISSVKKLSGVGTLEVSLVCEIDGQTRQESEILDLGHDALRVLCSDSIFHLLKATERWELGV